MSIMSTIRHPLYPSMRPAEKRDAIIRSLREHPDWSDRLLAQLLGFSRELIAKVRRELEQEGAILPQLARTGGDRKTYHKAGMRHGRAKGPLDLTTSTILRTTKQVLSDVFVLAYWAATPQDRGLFQAAARQLATRAGELEGGRDE